MANASPLQTTGLPGQTSSEAAATTSPARGQEMRNFLQSRLLQKNRAPPLVHSWDFWHDRQDRPSSKITTNGSTNTSDKADSNGSYEARLELLAGVPDVRAFWSVFNNFDITRLQLRDSIHLFHKGIRPVWEDTRNVRGGSWTFRVPKSQAAEFWKEVCMMAIGEALQEAVESERTIFRDDICGISLSVRFNSMLIQVWNRDGEHKEGIERIERTVMEGLSEELRPREGTYYYKKHSEHAGFTGLSTQTTTTSSRFSTASQTNGASGERQMQSLDTIVDEPAPS